MHIFTSPLNSSILLDLSHITANQLYLLIATSEAHSGLEKADDMASFYDIHCQAAPVYKIGDKVWLNAQNISTTQPMKKLDHKWLSPYPINKSHNAYSLELPPSFCCTHLVFSVVLLHPYEEDPVPECYSPPPPPPII